MKRAGFTMIELIFVIVILGILSAVALPKFIGVSEQANAGKCKAFVGTLNRTVGPSLWSDAVLNGTPTPANAVTTALMGAQITIPSECLLTAGTVGTFIGNEEFTIGAGVYDMNFTAGTTTEAPIWTWVKQ